MKERKCGGVKGAEERRKMREGRILVTGRREGKGRAAEIGDKEEDKSQKLKVDGGRKKSERSSVTWRRRERFEQRFWVRLKIG